ncbi:MAG: tetratricopeptide repeat protein [Comamonadaceae bacterium]|nr:MAG: tetratricopeptide repeat protein [Comamonadaceae bacterium]
MRERLEKLLATGRDSALLRFGLGNACLKTGDAESAAVHLAQATQQQPGYSAAWKLLGTALRKLERLEEAEAAWNTGLEVARQQGDLQSAREMMVFIKRLQPRGPV